MVKEDGNVREIIEEKGEREKGPNILLSENYVMRTLGL